VQESADTIRGDRCDRADEEHFEPCGGNRPISGAFLE